MLKKLLKYDLQNVFKLLVVFYILSCIFGVLARIFLSFDNSFIVKIIGQVCSGVTIAMIINILINNIMRLWVRFKNNFYGDESYLTHTLPVEKKTLYLSKTLASIITLFTSMIVITLTLFIAYYSKENIELLKNLLMSIADAYGSSIIRILLAFLFVFFLQIANALQMGYTGIVLGHRVNNLKVGYSIVFGLIFYAISQITAIAMLFLISLFNKDFMNLFITNDIVSVDALKAIIYIVIAIYLVILLVGYFINLNLFKKGVNVD